MKIERSIIHGKEYSYSRKGCRCEACKKAKRDSTRNTPIKKHGTTWGYDKGCRCDECRHAKAKKWEKYHPDVKPPTTDIENRTRKCIYCDITKPLEEFHKNIREFLGRDYRCKLCKNKRSRENKNTPGHRFSTYQSGAKTRKISFNLSFEEFNSFWDKPCYYCGVDINGIGLDRKDPKDGYRIENIVPCCVQCNRAKTIQTTEEFISMCIRVAQKFKDHIVSSEQAKS